MGARLRPAQGNLAALFPRLERPRIRTPPACLPTGDANGCCSFETDLKRTRWIIGFDTTDGQKAIRKGRREMTQQWLPRQEEEVTEERSKDMHRTEVDREAKRLNRRLLIGAAVVAVLLMGACQSGEDPMTDQAPGATEAQEHPANAKAEEVATSFVEAYGAFDADRAITYLADGAALSGMGLEGTREFRLLLSFFQAQGYKQMLTSCEETGSSFSSTYVRCGFDFHAIRSDEIGLGPYSGSYFDLTITGGEIVRVSEYFEIGEFSPQMWEPFAEWVSTNHPEDAAVMYNETLSDYRLSEESIRLWERHSRGYVEEVGTAG
jgi:outer membrane murein-binding lipoprotein Lpp